MIELKKDELEQVLLNITTLDRETGKVVTGLLIEEIPLGTKRNLQKIHKKALELYKELMVDMQDVAKECGEDKVKLEAELKALLAEIVKIDSPRVSMSVLENISSKTNYNFDILEKIAT